MIVLALPSHKLQMVLSANAGVELRWYVAFDDLISQSRENTQEPLQTVLTGASNDTTDVDMVTMPSDGLRRTRRIRHISVHNADGATTHTVAIKVYDGTNANIVQKRSVTPNQTLTFEEASGWAVA